MLYGSNVVSILFKVCSERVRNLTAFELIFSHSLKAQVHLVSLLSFAFYSMRNDMRASERRSLRFTIYSLSLGMNKRTFTHFHSKFCPVTGSLNGHRRVNLHLIYNITRINLLSIMCVYSRFLSPHFRLLNESKPFPMKQSYLSLTKMETCGTKIVVSSSKALRKM